MTRHKLPSRTMKPSRRHNRFHMLEAKASVCSLTLNSERASADTCAVCNFLTATCMQAQMLIAFAAVQTRCAKVVRSVKMQFFQCIVMSVLLYSGETWAVVKQHISPLAVFQMNCLRRICGISLRDHVPNVVILNRCNTVSVAFQLQGKRLRWLGHVSRMPNDRLPKKLLFGEVKGLRPPGRPRSSLNDVAIRDCQNCRISRPYRDAQDRLLWRDKTCPART